MKILLFVIAMSLPILPLALAQDSPGIVDELAQQPFLVDFAAFRNDASESLHVEVYYKIYSSILAFHKWGDKFKAEYTVDVIVNRKGKQITGTSNEGELIAENYKASISKDDFVINRVSFTLLPDDYQLIAQLGDPASGELIQPLKLDMKLKDFRKKIPELSSLEFLREATGVTDDSQFVRSNLRLIPSVARIYGDEEPEVILYYEIYNVPEFAGDYAAFYIVSDGEKDILADTTIFPSDGAITSHLERISVSELLAGEYDLRLRIESPGNDLELSRKTDFKIGWSVIGIVKNDFKTAVEQLRYIAAEELLKQLRDSPEIDREDRWNEFWKSQDPTPSTPENEKKEEYYKRLRYADLNFGHFGRDGWKTDMGMVYITYGTPDEIERHPFDIDSKPYQIWFFYSLKLKFTFVDINGYGEYELIYPYDGDIRKFR